MNPVSKVRIIVDTMTTDKKKANLLMGVIAHELTIEEINKFYEELTNKSNQLKLKL